MANGVNCFMLDPVRDPGVGGRVGCLAGGCECLLCVWQWESIPKGGRWGPWRDRDDGVGKQGREMDGPYVYIIRRLLRWQMVSVQSTRGSLCFTLNSLGQTLLSWLRCLLGWSGHTDEWSVLGQDGGCYDGQWGQQGTGEVQWLLLLGNSGSLFHGFQCFKKHWIFRKC